MDYYLIDFEPFSQLEQGLQVAVASYILRENSKKIPIFRRNFTLMKWKIVADSGSNILEYKMTNASAEFKSVPLMLNIGTDVYIDNTDLDLTTLLNAMEFEKTASSSACPAPDTYAQAFEGAENVLCFTLSSALSGSYNSAVLGANIFKETHPDVNIHIFDTLTAGAEIDLLVQKAIELVEQGLEWDEVINALNEYHTHTDVTFILETVDNLVKNGRISKLVGSMIGLLGIRLVGIRTPEGKIELAHKAKGTKRAMKTTLGEMISRGYNGGKAIISHCTAQDTAETFKQLILEHYPQAAIEICQMNGLCSYYAQRNGLIIGFEK